MPNVSKVWKLIGNGFAGVLTLAMAILGICVFPLEELQKIMPYAGSQGVAMKALFYAPIITPAWIVLGTLGCYYRFGRRLQDTLLSLMLLTFFTSFAALVFYDSAGNDFLDNHIVYQGNCRPLGIAVKTEGNNKSLYANFTCDNDPNHIFKVWDPDIIAFVATYPESRSREYKLSAGHTLFPVSTIAEKK